MIIGGIEVFLPLSPVVARDCVAEAAIEEEHADKMLTPWEKELEMLEDWMNNTGPVNDCHEQTVLHNFGEEHSEELLKYFIQGDG
jgi:hypothetical protein